MAFLSEAATKFLNALFGHYPILTIDSMTMTPNQLAIKIGKLRARLPITTEFKRVVERRGTWSSSRTWYTSQKQHWRGWLSGYHGPGYYDRKNWHRSANFVYNHILCPPMVLWLGEASGLPKARVVEAKQAALSASPNRAAQCAAIRKIIPWEMIEVRLGKSAGRKRKVESKLAEKCSDPKSEKEHAWTTA